MKLSPNFSAEITGLAIKHQMHMSELEGAGKDLPRDARFFTYDVLINTLGYLDGDFSSLRCCSQVSRIFRDASATYLYRSVTYSPAFSPVLNLRKQDDFAVRIQY